MAWRDHVRRLSKQMFADGTTVDGTRLERFLRDIAGRFNAARASDLKKRYVRNGIVCGWTPQDPARGTVHRFPFLPSENLSADVLGTEPPWFPENRWRVKGIHAPGMGPDEHYVWTTRLWFQEAAILDSVSLVMRHDSSVIAVKTFDIDYIYGTPPSGYGAGSNCEDLALQVHVMSPFGKEDARLSRVLVHRAQFQEALDTVSGKDLALAGAFDDMTYGPDDFGDLTGLYIPLEKLEVPIPAQSRVNICVAIPAYGGAGTPEAWNALAHTGTEHAECCWNLEASWLEEVGPWPR
jgi:hypothetical protein